MESLPLSKSGKINRRALPIPSFTNKQELSNQSHGLIKQKILLELWRELPGPHVNSIDSNFFHLGGDSIKALRLLPKAKTKGTSLRIQDIFEHRTIRALTEFLDRKENDEVAKDKSEGRLSRVIRCQIHILQCKNGSFLSPLVSHITGICQCLSGWLRV